MKSQIRKAQEEFGVKFVAVCTGSIETAIRRELVKDTEFSHLGSFPCMVHQVSFFNRFFSQYIHYYCTDTSDLQRLGLRDTTNQRSLRKK